MLDSILSGIGSNPIKVEPKTDEPKPAPTGSFDDVFPVEPEVEPKQEPKVEVPPINNIPVPNKTDSSVNTVTPPGDLFSLFMENVDPSTMGLSVDDVNKLQTGVEQISSTKMSMIALCNSEECKQKTVCPFNKINKFPTGLPCPVEKAISEFMSKEYYAMLADELDSTEFNIIEINTIQSLIEVELEEFRARTYATTNGQIVQNAAFVEKDSGEIIYNDIENPIYNLREKLDRRKAKLLQRLLITPEAKARFKIEDKNRTGRKTEDLISSAEEKIQQLKTDNLDGSKGSKGSTK